MSAPVLSVIVPVYKAEPFLRQCLRSLLVGQGDPESFEVIAIDDASPDASTAILADYSSRHPNLRVIRFPENRGVGTARNVGIDAAQGEWLAFCDSDDAFVRGAIPRLLEELKHANCEVAVFNLARVEIAGSLPDASMEPSGRILDMTDPAVAVPFVLQAFPNRLWAWNKCFHRSLVGPHRFPDFQPCEDAVFTLDCLLRAKRVLTISDVLSEYVQHAGSCMRTVSANRIRGDALGMEALFRTISTWPHFPEVRRAVRRNLKDVFLRGTCQRLAAFHPENDSAKKELVTLFFRSAISTFCNPTLSPPAPRALFKMILVPHSLSLLSLALRLESRVRRLSKAILGTLADRKRNAESL